MHPDRKNNYFQVKRTLDLSKPEFSMVNFEFDFLNTTYADNLTCNIMYGTDQDNLSMIITTGYQDQRPLQNVTKCTEYFFKAVADFDYITVAVTGNFTTCGVYNII